VAERVVVLMWLMWTFIALIAGVLMGYDAGRAQGYDDGYADGLQLPRGGGS
jgi:hypothetical protein